MDRSVTGPTGELAWCIAAQHVEGKAALQIRSAASTGGTIHHNHPNGTCLYCLHALPALLPPGASLTIVPPAAATAPSPWWIVQQVTFTGNPPRSVVPAAQGPGALAAYSLGEAVTVSTAEALIARLQRVGAPDHFTISPAPAGHPLLTMAVSGEAWVVHYFASPNDPGSIATAGAVQQGAAQRPAYFQVPDPAGVPVSLPGTVAIDQRAALAVAWEFAATWARPCSVNWLPVVPGGHG